MVTKRMRYILALPAGLVAALVAYYLMVLAGSEQYAVMLASGVFAVVVLAFIFGNRRLHRR